MKETATRHRHSGGRQRGNPERRGRREDAPREIADVEVLALHRRAGLAHLREEDHADDLRVGAHREHGAEIADERRHDIARPGAVAAAILLAAAEPDSGRVDRLLAERAESLSLEWGAAMAHLASREEGLQAIVGGARQEHSAEDLDPLLPRQARGNRFPREEAVARLEELAPRLLQARRDGDARRRLGQARRRRRETQEEGLREPGAQRLDRPRVAPGVPGTDLLERRYGRREREGVALGDKGGKTPRDPRPGAGRGGQRSHRPFHESDVSRAMGRTPHSHGRLSTVDCRLTATGRSALSPFRRGGPGGLPGRRWRASSRRRG